MTPADAIEVPLRVFPQNSNEWNLTGATITPGQTLAGAFPILRLDGGGLWVGRINDVHFANDASLVKLWRALRIAAENGVMPMVWPREDAMMPPYPVVDGVQVTEQDQLAHDDDMLFSDDTGYDQAIIAAESVGAAALRATSMTIHFLTGEPLEGGECFSIKHPNAGWRLYEIMRVSLDGSGDSVVEFRPPLREAVEDATAIEFDNPRCTMRLKEPNSMAFKLSTWPFTNQTVELVEYLFP